MVGVPYDGSTSGRSGTRFGPRALRQASLDLWNYHPKHKIAPAEVLRLVDYGDVDVVPPSIAQTMAEIESTISAILDANATCVMLGGDHSIILPSLRAHARKYGPVGIVQIDAHPDTWDTDFKDVKYGHGTGFRRAVEEGLIDTDRYVMVGIRGPVGSPNDIDEARAHCTRLIDMEEALDLGIPAVLDIIRQILGGGPTYLSFDIDSCDPAYAPGTGTPEVGGFTSHQALQLVRGLDGLHFVGGDLVEVNPLFDTAEITALLGANLLFEFLCLLAKQKERWQK